jgi:hypothetical protein
VKTAPGLFYRQDRGEVDYLSAAMCAIEMVVPLQYHFVFDLHFQLLFNEWRSKDCAKTVQ